MARPYLRDPGKERFWRRQVGGWKRSGLTIRDYCQRHGLPEPSFYAWRRTLAERAQEQARRRPPEKHGLAISKSRNAQPASHGNAQPASHGRNAQPASKSRSIQPRIELACNGRVAGPAFLPMRLLLESTLAAAAAPIEIVLGGGLVVRVPSGFERQTLREVLAVLDETKCRKRTHEAAGQGEEESPC